jgi:hypothetical protein
MKTTYERYKCKFFQNSHNLDYSRVEVAVDARRRPMKLWSSTTNWPQRSIYGEIDSPER